MASIDDVIREFRELKDKKKRAEDQLKEALAPTVERMDKIKGVLKAYLQKSGVDSAATAEGTAYLSTKASVTVKDKQAFMDYIRDGNWEYADVRASKANIMEQLEATGEIPAGVNISQFIDVNIRKGK